MGAQEKRKEEIENERGRERPQSDLKFSFDFYALLISSRLAEKLYRRQSDILLKVSESRLL